MPTKERRGPPAKVEPRRRWERGELAELVDAADCQSAGASAPCRFESGPRHLNTKLPYDFRHLAVGVNYIMCGFAAGSRIPPKLAPNWMRNYAIQLDFFDEIGENIYQAGANGAGTPPPPNQDGGSSSTMTTYYNTTTPTYPQPRKTYPQDWPVYNAAQHREQEHFVELLRGLCDTIPQPPQTFGRPRLPISDVVFGIAWKVYSTMSGRRVMTGFREAQAKGLVDKAPSFTSTFRYLENPN